MASDKPFYKLTIKLDSARADALAEAIQQLRDIASDYDTAAQSSATLIFESYQEAPIIGIREQFELWLHRYQIGLGCEVTQKSPGVRPETILALRAMHRTPMDDVINDEDFVITVCDNAHEELGVTGNLHWSIPDPVRVGSEEAFDAAYDELECRITELAPRLAAH